MTSLTIRVPDRIRALLGMLDTELTPAQFVAWIGPNVGHPEVQAFAREVLAPPRPSDAPAPLEMSETSSKLTNAIADVVYLRISNDAVKCRWCDGLAGQHECGCGYDRLDAIEAALRAARIDLAAHAPNAVVPADRARIGMTLDLRAMAARLAQTADELLHEPRLTSPQTRSAEAFVALVRDLGRLLDLIDDRAMSQDQARELWERTEKLAEVETSLASAREEIARLTAERERGGDLAAELRAIAADARAAARTMPVLADVFETRAAGIDAALALATERLAAKGGAR